MSSFLADFLSKLGSQIFSGLIAWWERRKLEQRARLADLLEQQIQGMRENRLREEQLREELRREVSFSYDAWEAQK